LIIDKSIPLEARGNAREIVNTVAAMLHAVKSAVGGGQQFFRCVTVFGKSRSASARGRMAIQFEDIFVNAVDDVRCDVGRLPENDGNSTPP
jgi:hypothetical protein